VHARDDVLVFESEPLVAALTLIGCAVAHLWVSSDAPDTDWFAELADADPDGGSFLVAYGMLRARFRSGLDREELMEADAIYPVTVELTPRAHTFAPGHRMTLAVTSSASPLWAPNPNNGGDIFTDAERRVARNCVHHSPGIASHVVLPLLDDGGG